MKIRTLLLLDIETELTDDPKNLSDENTLRYLVEEDLQDLGYDVHTCEVVLYYSKEELDKFAE